MPLSCDCYGGCWADHSKDWPYIIVPEFLINAARSKNPHYPLSVAAHRLCNTADIVYGGYVISGNHLRIENKIDLAKVKILIEGQKNAPS